MTDRADVALTARGLARSRSEAAQLVKAGLVLADGAPVTRAAQKVGEQTVLSLADDGPRYVSRAAHKLLSALEAFPEVSAQSRRCLDAGACTGGFTQVLLQAGAAVVAAVDVGHDQLHPQVREDRRVLVREGLNVRSLTVEDIAGPVELVVSDLSFISLRLVVEALAGVCVPGADLLLMVKPQFEVGRSALPRSGVVTDPAARRRAVEQVLAAAARAGLRARGLARSGLPGQDGNVEFFLWLKHTGEHGPAGLDAVPGAGAVDWG